MSCKTWILHSTNERGNFNIFLYILGNLSKCELKFMLQVFFIWTWYRWYIKKTQTNYNVCMKGKKRNVDVMVW